jgi:hypothetical protein
VIRRLTITLAVALVAAACGNATTPTAAPPTVVPTIFIQPTEAPTPTAAPPTVVATTAPAGPFDNVDYALTLPEGWTTFDMKDPAGQAALDAFVAANPDMAGSIEAFKVLPNVVMAVNQLLGNVIVTLSVPTGGATLDVIAASFTTQFAAVPGVKEAPTPDDVTLPVGPAKHWHLEIEANDPSGGTSTVGESIYVAVNGANAVLVEFVEVGGTAVPQEQQIVQSLAFK